MNRVQRLRAMGLTAWERRSGPAPSGEAEAPAATSAEPGGWELIVERSAAQIPVVVAHPAPFRYVRGQPAADLLGRILSALQIPAEAFAIIRVDHGGDCTRAVEGLIGPSPERIILFAPDPPAPADDRVIRLPGLQQMLADPDLKRPAWDTLKPWVGKLLGS